MLDESVQSGITREKNTAHSEFINHSDERLPEIQSHLSRLSNLLNKLRSISDRASDDNGYHASLSQDFELLVIAALREAECADFIEKSMETDLTSLCEELKQKNEALRAREIELSGLDETLKVKLGALENQIQSQEIQLDQMEKERRGLTTEREDLVNRLIQAELRVQQAETQARESNERLELELSALRFQTAKREEWLDSREADMRRAEADQKATMENLELRLREMEEKLTIQEKELNEKHRGILAAFAREAEIGKLIERLSSECERLSAELYEKSLIIARSETKTRYSLIKNGKAWQKLLRLLGVVRPFLGQQQSGLAPNRQPWR